MSKIMKLLTILKQFNKMLKFLYFWLQKKTLCKLDSPC